MRLIRPSQDRVSDRADPHAWTTAPTPAPAPLNSSRTTAADGGRLRLNPHRSVPKRAFRHSGTGLTSSLSQRGAMDVIVEPISGEDVVGTSAR